MSLSVIMPALSFAAGALVGVAAHCYFSTAAIDIEYYRSLCESQKDSLRKAKEQCEVLGAAITLDAKAAKKEIKTLRRENALLKKNLRRRRRIFKSSARGAHRNKYKSRRPRRKPEPARIMTIVPDEFYNAG